MKFKRVSTLSRLGCSVVLNARGIHDIYEQCYAVMFKKRNQCGNLGNLGNLVVIHCVKY